MSVIDKVTGRLNNAAGDGTEDPELRRHGVIDMRAGEANDDRRESREFQRHAPEVAEVAELERRRR